jgi:hypothetical protein
MTHFEKLVDNPATYIGICLALGIVGFGVGFLVGALY